MLQGSLVLHMASSSTETLQSVTYLSFGSFYALLYCSCDVFFSHKETVQMLSFILGLFFYPFDSLHGYLFITECLALLREYTEQDNKVSDV